MKKSFHYSYLALCLVHLIAEQLDVEWLVLATKPLLITILLIGAWDILKKPLTKPSRFLLFGLFFSIGGDSLLMLVERGPRLPLFFLLGLGSFLIAHIWYLLSFRQMAQSKEGYLSAGKWWRAWPLILFWAGMLALLLPRLEVAMQVPVALYATAIVTMAMSAMHLYGILPNRWWRMLMAGVLLFVFSDAVIAINKFVTVVPGARLLIMTTYLLGQYWIVEGAIGGVKEQD